MRRSDFVTVVRQHARALWDALNALEVLQHEWNALDYSATLMGDGNEDAGGFVGENAHLDVAQVGAVVFDTANAIRDNVMSMGHATNLARLL